MSIRTNRRRGIRVGLRNGAWGSSGNWSSRSLEWKCFLHCRINSEGGSMKSLTTKNTAAWRNPCPQISNPGVHLKPENFWTSLTTSSLEEVTRGKMPLLCFLLGTIRNDTELQTSLEQGVQQPGQAMCSSHFHPHTQDWFWKEAQPGLQKLSDPTGQHMQVVSACTVPHRS